ncbi:MAG TPA: ATP-binding protein [Polyangia bacterium]|nr:ATP-binding protein [Polyangia bacterium]
MSASSRQLQHLAAAMAHEVRNPLNSMAIHVELLEGRLKREGELAAADRDAALRSATVMANEIERVDRILDEYLQYAGPEEAARRPVDASQLVADAVKRAHPHAERRGVGLEIKAAASLGQWAVDAEGLGDALDAVLDNAVEASPRGAVVDVSASSDQDQAQIVVADRGDGIAAEDLPRVFHIGFSKRGRSGIGLTVAKQIVKGHGGSILAESRGAGQGATFTIRLPLELES